jgi:hypothetical protein
MTNHPITPPPELVQQWICDYYGYSIRGELAGVENAIATRAAQWGADRELEACCKYISCEGKWFVNPGYRLAQLRAARRPKPQTLNSIALQMLGTIERDAHYLPEITDTIRRALEQLND